MFIRLLLSEYTNKKNTYIIAKLKVFIVLLCF
jgi:hypothetical protein